MDINNSPDYVAVTEKIRQYTLAAVKRSRYEHSMRVAETAQILCRKYGIDEKRGYLAGVGHDMCKDMSDILLVSIALRDGHSITPLERKKPALLHGRAAAVKMTEDFGIKDPEILQAVADHTFGAPDMCDLAKIIYVADKIEPGREYVTKAYMEKLAGLQLDGLVAAVLRDGISYLEKKGCMVAPESELFLESLEKNNAYAR
ncbi:MAG: bis(5'-nucleosyl)-tetraphosphatase (symmetrical) YqeK [Treponema sp.]|nr:bis(5'-nucleosyl)-tetraphosphatase (symmetrical) YqeK [Treponema sp.]